MCENQIFLFDLKKKAFESCSIFSLLVLSRASFSKFESRPTGPIRLESLAQISQEGKLHGKGKRNG